MKTAHLTGSHKYDRSLFKSKFNKQNHLKNLAIYHSDTPSFKLYSETSYKNNPTVFRKLN